LEDIPILIEEFKRHMKANFSIQSDVLKEFQKYRWEGNVRELRNYIEYFSNMQKSRIGISDIPFLQMQKSTKTINGLKDWKQLEPYFKKTGGSLSEAFFILDALNQARIDNKRVGRRSIAALSHEKNQYLSEMKIRSLLSQLRSLGFIMTLKGRGGTQITEEGIRFLQKSKKSS
jgi:transcriptional regulator with PAS, ATPase and Fis domain